MNVFVTPPILILRSVPSNQISPFTGVVGAVPDGILKVALAVVDGAKTDTPVLTSIALNSKAEIKLGWICNPLVIPLAPPVWLMTEDIKREVCVAVPLVGLNESLPIVTKFSVD